MQLLEAMPFTHGPSRERPSMAAEMLADRVGHFSLRDGIRSHDPCLRRVKRPYDPPWQGIRRDRVLL